MKFEKPNAREKEWRESVRLIGSIITGSNQCLIHHIVGRTARHNKQKVGHLLILPLTPAEHILIDYGQFGLKELKDSYNDNHGGNNKEIGPMSFREFQIYLFSRVCQVTKFPFSEQTYQTCLDYHR